MSFSSSRYFWAPFHPCPLSGRSHNKLAPPAAQVTCLLDFSWEFTQERGQHPWPWPGVYSSNWNNCLQVLDSSPSRVWPFSHTERNFFSHKCILCKARFRNQPGFVCCNVSQLLSRGNMKQGVIRTGRQGGEETQPHIKVYDTTLLDEQPAQLLFRSCQAVSSALQQVRDSVSSIVRCALGRAG